MSTKTTVMQVEKSQPVPVTRDHTPFFRGSMPLPPSVNRSYQVVVPRGKTYTRIGPTTELEQFKHGAALTLVNGYHDWPVIASLRAATERIPLSADIRVFLADNRAYWRRDLDGFLKQAIDATFAHLRLDDSLLISLHACKFSGSTNPQIEIDVYSMLATCL